MSDIKITAVVVCDDIRKEVTGKDILIGVYAGDIIVPEFPAVITATFWIEMTPGKLGKSRLRFRIRLANKDEAMPITIDVQFRELSTSAIATPQATIAIDAETDLLLEQQVGENWEILKSKKIYKGATIQPFNVSIGSPPPFSQS